MSIFQNSANCQHSRGYPGSVRGWKNRLRGLFNPVRLDQVRIEIKSSIIEPLGPPIHLLACFGQKFERKVFERMTSSRIWMFYIFIFIFSSLSLSLSPRTHTHLFINHTSFWKGLSWVSKYVVQLMVDLIAKLDSSVHACILLYSCRYKNWNIIQIWDFESSTNPVWLIVTINLHLLIQVYMNLGTAISKKKFFSS
jgi:hypothetical protein